ncbi:hydroxylamine reductase [Chromohalobacter japonicus]|uniref:Hydroxylamine reductase n=2 Tax=Chromohalobacter TaxID=42054 RepID=A0A1Q8TDL4_9GAMM|nr:MULTISPECIES: hydroxylamine reductase [Chromohalobacter]MCT8467827.1 hydroxylamine reductase [Chromohalobacter canadensis]MCT8470425.1 hydroxylamine reductase [Chromohalobacter canadensis]MCT8498324.1 hydroxylamine reductase [Chromohalobacter canadensis]OLO11770.1 hydroxylamine reductase [Chromohalobacter japonicus]SOC58302.1 hydroxylamine reductase precursor [Chromohalobacter canadensis]
MFCYQCEQTQRNGDLAGCATDKGTCGKDATTADLQDLLIYLIEGIAQYATRARTLGIVDNDVDTFIQYGFFTTLTNVNFAATRFVALIRQAAELRDDLKARYQAAAEAQGVIAEEPAGPARFQPAEDMDALLAQAPQAAVNRGHTEIGEDVNGLRMLILYGMKGVCAYSHHARMLGYRDDAIDAGIEELLDYLTQDPRDIEALLARALSAGELNLKVMALLDRANNETFGDQQITAVRVTPIKGKALLVSGHDLHDLRQILEQTAGQGINVYTHGEMLPAHAYPGLKKYPHLVGNYGGAWQDQQREFAEFPGPIVMTSNCIIEPDKRYRQRIFTTGPVGWPGVRHIDNGNFAPVIQAAKAMPGFKTDLIEQTVTVGFGHDTVLGLADQVVDAVKSGAIRHFFVIGGCDGAKPGRNYYTELADNTPDDSVILTMGCAKYRFNKHAHGDIGGIPRLLDMGQCNDAYSAIRVASALAEAFDCGVDQLPLSLMVSWFEQKATAVLLSLLAAGVKGIHLGPSLPAYLTPNLLEVMQERFDLRVNHTAEEDIALALAAG